MEKASKGQRAIACREDDHVEFAFLATEGDELLLTASDGKILCVSENEVNPTGKTAKGKTGIKIHNGAYCTGAALVADGVPVLTLTSDGTGKRTVADEFYMEKNGEKHTAKCGEIGLTTCRNIKGGYAEAGTLTYVDSNLSIGQSDNNTFKMTSHDGVAVVGHYFLQNGTTYTYYDGVLLNSDATQNADYTVGTGKTLTTLKSLTIGSGKTLTVDGGVTNYGVITNNGTIKLDTAGFLTGFSILKDLANGVFSGLIKMDANTYALEVRNTTSTPVASGVPDAVKDLFYNSGSLSIITQAALNSALGGANYTAIAINFNMLSDLIKPGKYYRVYQLNDALKPYLSPEDARVAAVTVSGASAYLKTPTTGTLGSSLLSDYYAMLLLEGKNATIQIYESDSADSLGTSVATIGILNQVSFTADT